MTQRRFSFFLTLLAVLSVGFLAAPSAQAQAYGTPAIAPVPNAYVPAASPYGVTAAMNPTPRPTPPLVGHTYITYDPLAPQEFLYTHHRGYYQYNRGSGLAWTSVTWWHKPTLWPFQPSLRDSVPHLHTPVTGPYGPNE